MLISGLEMGEDIAMKFGERIRARREELGLSRAVPF